jgi:hypothetical protein
MADRYLPEFPQTARVDAKNDTTRFALRLAAKLEDFIAENPEWDRPLLGVWLFRVSPAQKKLEGAPDAARYQDWRTVFTESTLRPGTGIEYPKFESVWLLAHEYCEALLGDAKVFDYLFSIKEALARLRVTLHLHYYRVRPGNATGFHKDTLGQTLFFLLHYLNKKPMYGAEYFFDGPTLTRSGSQAARQGPAEKTQGPWSEELRGRVRQARQAKPDDNIHVVRLEEYGALIAGDEVVSHSTPFPQTRAGLKLSVGIADQQHDKRRAYVPEVPIADASRSRSLSRDRTTIDNLKSFFNKSSASEVAEHLRALDPEVLADFGPEDLTLAERWAATFESTAPRQFFRIWVTVNEDNVFDRVHY